MNPPQQSFLHMLRSPCSLPNKNECNAFAQKWTCAFYRAGRSPDENNKLNSPKTDRINRFLVSNANSLL